MRFAGRVAFVTGASRGVGKALALRLAAEGCDVVVAAKTVAPDPKLPGTIHETAREIEALGRRALAAELDVRDDAAVERVAKQALDHFGQVDFLVNNAGALYWRSVAETEMKRFDLVMGVNARGAFACTRHLLPSMLARKFGHILMLSPPVDPRAGSREGRLRAQQVRDDADRAGGRRGGAGQGRGGQRAVARDDDREPGDHPLGARRQDALAHARDRRRRGGRHLQQAARRADRARRSSTRTSCAPRG